MEACTSSTRHPELVPMITRIYEAWQGALRSALQGGIDAGEFQPVVPLDQVLDAIMAMIDGLMITGGLRIYEFDPAYTSLLLQDIAGRLLGYDFATLDDDDD
jgi:hypothetical protein